MSATFWDKHWEQRDKENGGGEDWRERIDSAKWPREKRRVGMELSRVPLSLCESPKARTTLLLSGARRRERQSSGSKREREREVSSPLSRTRLAEEEEEEGTVKVKKDDQKRKQ